MTKNIYIVLSRTGTIPARLIRKATHTEYSHSSICFDDELKTYYSFGRKVAFTPLIGGFIKESPETGLYKKYNKCKMCVLKIEVDEGKYNEIKDYVEKMYENRGKYRYNYIGVLLAWINKNFKRKRHFYCSEFIADTLVKFGVVKQDCFARAIKPMDLYYLDGAKIVYEGEIRALFCEHSSETENKIEKRAKA